MAGAMTLVVSQSPAMAAPSLEQQLDWSQQWWQWALSVPAAANPLIDNRNAAAQTKGTGDVYFQAGSSASPGFTSTRAIDVPYGKDLFPSAANIVSPRPPDSPPAAGNCLNPVGPTSLSCAQKIAIDFMATATDMKAAADGKDIAYSPSKGPPADNLFGDPSLAGPHSAVSDDYWTTLPNQTVGQHTPSFQWDIGQGNTTVSDRLNVLPEPNAGLLLLPALALLVGLSRRRPSRS
jgi:hypothetical protein